MAGSNYSEDEPIASINVTPLVDVVLVLLVIFLITAPALYQSAIKVQLPKAQTGESSALRSPLDFTLDQSGAVAWGREKLDWAELEKRLASRKEPSPDDSAMISADQATPHGRVVKLMDLLRKNGIVKFALNVDTPMH